MASLDDQQKTTASMVSDLTKQIITLSSAFLTVTVTFSKDLLAIVDTPDLLRWIWVTLAVSVGFGLLTMMTLTGRVQKATAPAGGAAVFSLDRSLRLWSVLQILTFAVAVVLLVVVGWSVIGEAVPKK